MLLEMGQKFFQQRVGEAVLIGEVHIAEHAAQAQVRIFDSGEGVVQTLADLGSLLSHGIPTMLRGDMETVFVRVSGLVPIASFSEELFILLVPHVAEPLIKQEAEDVLLVVPGIDRATEDVGSLPQVTFEALLGKGGHEILLFRRDLYVSGTVRTGDEMRRCVVDEHPVGAQTHMLRFPQRLLLPLLQPQPVAVVRKGQAAASVL